MLCGRDTLVLPGVTAKRSPRCMSRSSEAAGRRLYSSTASSSSLSACVGLCTSETTESLSQLKCRAKDTDMGKRIAIATWPNTWAREGFSVRAHAHAVHGTSAWFRTRIACCFFWFAPVRVHAGALYVPSSTSTGRGTPTRSRRQVLHTDCAALLSILWRYTLSLALASRPLLDDGTCACTLFLRASLSLSASFTSPLQSAAATFALHAASPRPVV